MQQLMVALEVVIVLAEAYRLLPLFRWYVQLYIVLARNNLKSKHSLYYTVVHLCTHCS